MGKQDYGVVKSQVPLNSMAERDRMVRAYRGIGDFLVQMDELRSPSWGIDGRWVEDESA